MAAPAREASSRSPVMNSRAQLTGRSAGALKPITRATGRAPIASMSAMLTATDLRPMSWAPDQFRRK